MIDEDVREGQDQWARKIVARDRQCQLCDTKEDLQGHHKDGNPKNNSLQNGVTLCRSCNMKMERIIGNADKFLPPPLEYIGIYRQMANLGRGYKALSRSISTNPLELIGLKDSLTQIQQQLLKATNTKNALSDDEFDKFCEDFGGTVFTAGFRCGYQYCLDTLKAFTPELVAAWMKVRGIKLLEDCLAEALHYDTRPIKWEIVKGPVKEPKP